MFSVKIINTRDKIEQTFNLFNKLHIDHWKFKDDWLTMIDNEYGDISHNKVQLIDNETNQVVLEKELKNPSKYNTRYPLQYYKNIIYDTVRKSIGMRLYKKDKYGLAYAILPYIVNDTDPCITYEGSKLFYGYCKSPYIVGDLCESEDKAYTNVKQKTYDKLLNFGIKMAKTYVDDIIMSEINNDIPTMTYGY